MEMCTGYARVPAPLPPDDSLPDYKGEEKDYCVALDGAGPVEWYADEGVPGVRLRPCPFCGGEAVMRCSRPWPGRIAEELAAMWRAYGECTCEYCGIEGPAALGQSPVEAIRAARQMWDERAPEGL